MAKPLTILLLLIFFFSIASFRSPNVISTNVQFASKDQSKQIAGRIFTPSDQNPKAAVVLVHGVIVNKEYMAAMAKHLASHGFVALTFDLGGYGESFPRPESATENNHDLHSAICYLLTKFPDLTKNKVGLVGHSMGGSAVVQVAQNDPDIRTAICVGMGAKIAQPDSDRFLFITGLYDSFHSPSDLRKLNPGSSLYVSPTANHQTEMSDRRVHRKVVTWLSDKLGVNESGSSASLAIDQKVFSTIGSLLALTFFSFLLGLFPKSRVTGWLISVMILVVILAANFSWLDPVSASAIVLGAILMLVIVPFARDNNRRSSRLALLIVGGLIVVESVNILNAFGEFVAHPEYLLSVPAYLFQSIITYISTTTSTVRPVCFSSYSESLIPSWILIVILAAELIHPGLILKIVTFGTEKLYQLSNTSFRISSKVSGKQALLLGSLLVVLVLIGWQRVAAGFLNQETLLALGNLLISRILPIVVLMFVLLRLASRRLAGSLRLSTQ